MKDATWVMYQKRIEEAIAESNWFTLGIIYYEMAERVEDEGTDGQYLRDQGYQSKLKAKQTDLDNHFLSEVEIIVNSGACSSCTLFDRDILSAEDARLNNPLPVKDCSNVLGCRCMYLPVIE